MDTDQVKYLKKRYRDSLKVKLHNELQSQFATVSWNYRAVSESIQTAFPHSVSKTHRKVHHRYIHVNIPGASSSDSMEKEELLA